MILYHWEEITMARALSVDLRDRVIRYVLDGRTRHQAAKVFGIAPSTAIKYLASYMATGAVEPKKQGGDQRSKLTAHGGSYILRRVREIPDMTLSELTEELTAQGIQIHFSTVSRFLKAQGFSFKKKLWWPPNRSDLMCGHGATNG